MGIPFQIHTHNQCFRKGFPLKLQIIKRPAAAPAPPGTHGGAPPAAKITNKSHVEPLRLHLPWLLDRRELDLAHIELNIRHLKPGAGCGLGI